MVLQDNDISDDGPTPVAPAPNSLSPVEAVANGELRQGRNSSFFKRITDAIRSTPSPQPQENGIEKPAEQSTEPVFAGVTAYDPGSMHLLTKQKTTVTFLRLPAHVASDDVEELCAAYGPVFNCKIILDPEGKPTGYAVADFAWRADAEKAVTFYSQRSLDGIRIGCYIRDSEAVPRQRKPRPLVARKSASASRDTDVDNQQPVNVLETQNSVSSEEQNHDVQQTHPPENLYRYPPLVVQRVDEPPSGAIPHNTHSKPAPVVYSGADFSVPPPVFQRAPVEKQLSWADLSGGSSRTNQVPLLLSPSDSSSSASASSPEIIEDIPTVEMASPTPPPSDPITSQDDTTGAGFPAPQKTLLPLPVLASPPMPTHPPIKIRTRCPAPVRFSPTVPPPVQGFRPGAIRRSVTSYSARPRGYLGVRPYVVPVTYNYDRLPTTRPLMIISARGTLVPRAPFRPRGPTFRVRFPTQ